MPKGFSPRNFGYYIVKFKEVVNVKITNRFYNFLIYTCFTN